MAADPLLVALAFALVLVNAFFVAAEFAMVRVRETRITPLAEAGNWQARAAASLQKRLDAFLSATQLGITLSSLGLGWIGEPAFATCSRRCSRRSGSSRPPSSTTRRSPWPSR